MALVLRQVPDISRYGEAVLTEGRLTGFNEKTAERKTRLYQWGNLSDDKKAA